MLPRIGVEQKETALLTEARLVVEGIRKSAIDDRRVMRRRVDHSPKRLSEIGGIEQPLILLLYIVHR